MMARSAKWTTSFWGRDTRWTLAAIPFCLLASFRSLQRVNGFPKLNSAFEASLPGIHFLGATLVLAIWTAYVFCRWNGIRRSNACRPCFPAAGENHNLGNRSRTTGHGAQFGLTLFRHRAAHRANRSEALVVGGDFHGLAIVRSLGRLGDSGLRRRQ